MIASLQNLCVGVLDVLGGLLLTAARIEHEQTALQRQIDALVYELGVYPVEPRRMAGDGGRLTEEMVILEGD